MLAHLTDSPMVTSYSRPQTNDQNPMNADSRINSRIYNVPSQQNSASKDPQIDSGQ